MRRAGSEDASALAAVHIPAWRAAYRGVMPDQFLDGLDHVRWTEQWKQRLAGRPALRIPDMVLLAGLLLRAAEAALQAAGWQEIVLWVVSANDRARRFYERAGWHADGAEKRDRGMGFEVHEVRYARRLSPGATAR